MSQNRQKMENISGKKEPKSRKRKSRKSRKKKSHLPSRGVLNDIKDLWEREKEIIQSTVCVNKTYNEIK